MAARPYLLDTSIILTVMNGKALGQYIDATFGLRATKQRPLACIVSHGELRALAKVNGFDSARSSLIETTLANLVTVDISDDSVVASYVEVYSALRSHPKGAQTNAGENDMWIAAATRAAGALLLTLDKHFDSLHPAVIERVYIPRNVASAPNTPTG